MLFRVIGEKLKDDSIFYELDLGNGIYRVDII